MTRPPVQSSFKDSIRGWFPTTVGVRQQCLLLPTLFNIFVERVMTGALEDHGGTISIGGWTIINLRFVHNIHGLAGEGEELAKLAEHLNKASTAYVMEISAVKTKFMTDNTSGISKIKVNRQELETITSFKYLGSVVSDKDSKPEILSRTTQMTTALTRLKPVWNDWCISLSTKIRLMRSSAWHILLLVCLWIMDPNSRAAKKNTSRGN